MQESEARHELATKLFDWWVNWVSWEEISPEHEKALDKLEDLVMEMLDKKPVDFLVK